MISDLLIAVKRGEKGYLWQVLIALVGFTIPYSPRVNTLFIGLTLLYWLFFRATRVLKLATKSFSIPFLFLFGFYFIGILSLLYTEQSNLLGSYHAIAESRFSLLLIPVLFLPLFDNKDLLFGFYAFFAGVFFFCLLINLQVLYTIWALNEPLSYFFTKYIREEMFQLATFHIHSMYLSMMVIVVITINVYFFYTYGLFKNTWSVLGFSVVFVYLLLMLYLIGARTSILTLGIIGLLYLLYWIYSFTKLKFAAKFLISLFTVFASVAIFWGFSQDLALKIEQHYEMNQYSPESVIVRTVEFLREGDRARTISWNSALGVIKSNPWLGVGAGDYIDEMQKLRPVGSWSYENRADAHNQYLDTTTQVGIVGLFFWLAFYIGLMIKGLREHNHVLLIFMLIIGLAMVTESILHEHRGIILVSFFCSLIARYNPKQQIGT
jgi:O-antigen ligase